MTQKGICTSTSVAVLFAVSKIWKQLVSVNRWMDKDVRFIYTYGVPRDKESTCQCRKWGFNSWVGKIPWSRKWQPTPVFLPGEPPWTEEPGRLQPMGSQIVEHDWVTENAHTYKYTYIHIHIYIMEYCSPIRKEILSFSTTWMKFEGFMLSEMSQTKTSTTCVLSHFSCVQLFATPWTVAFRFPLSIWILQERILEWVAMPSSRGSSQPRVSCSCCIAGEFFTTEPQGRPLNTACYPLYWNL